MKRILILDDDPTVLLPISRALQRPGLEVITCRELEAAEAILESLPVDVMITDLCVSPLGGLDGIRLIKHLAANYPAIRLLVVSGNAEESVVRLCRSHGAAAVLAKPVQLGLLVRETCGLLGEVGSEPSRIADVEDLEAFLEAGSVSALFQPIVSLRGDAEDPAYGYESLARGPAHSLLRNPELLFTYASRKGRLYETDMLCIRAALKEISWLPKGARLFLNVQPRSLTQPRFVEALSEAVRGAGLGSERVVMELTEQQTILNPTAFSATLGDLRNRGFRIALDDYGTGFSNLQLLEELRPDFLKISGHLCMGLDLHRSKQIIVSSTARMARLLGIPTILEHVETPGERDAAHDLGVDFAQGYLYSRPAPGREFARAAEPARIA